MKLVNLVLKSISPYSQSKHYDVEKKDREQPADYEKRTWKERCHFKKDDNRIYIPPSAIKNCLSDVAKFLSIKIPGGKNATYTKHFESGILVQKEVFLKYQKNNIEVTSDNVDKINLNDFVDVTMDNLESESLFVPSDGQRGGGKRVVKIFPLIRDWIGLSEIYILDEIITEDVFKKHIESAGKFIGLGRFRPRNNGYYGRFEVIKYDFIDIT